MMDAYGVLKESFGFLIVAMLWGCTNPLIKKYSTGNSFFNDIRKGNWKIVVLFLLNQAGSVANLSLLSTQNLVRQPVCNALTCLFTAITALWIGEKYHSLSSILQGCFCILIGTAVVLHEDAQTNVTISSDVDLDTSVLNPAPEL
eukprot:INCI10641.1.p2 GENE.INCI10641.1~~INCI10641.1.p2  ORF type:complete len:145 (-),score=21.68 INCI10641.1:83-517(-)